MPANPYSADRRTRNVNPASSPRIVEQCLKTKQMIISELVAGRLEFLEAASRFHAVDSASDECGMRATGMGAELSVSENMCRTLIGWVHLSLSGNRPEQAERVSDRLERELECYLDRGVKVKQQSAVC